MRHTGHISTDAAADGGMHNAGARHARVRGHNPTLLELFSLPSVTDHVRRTKRRTGIPPSCTVRFSQPRHHKTLPPFQPSSSCPVLTEITSRAVTSHTRYQDGKTLILGATIIRAGKCPAECPHGPEAARRVKRCKAEENICPSSRVLVLLFAYCPWDRSDNHGLKLPACGSAVRTRSQPCLPSTEGVLDTVDPRVPATKQYVMI